MSSSLEGKTGMIAPKQSRQKQRVVIAFLLSEGETAQNISRRLKQVYGDVAIDYSTVTKWVKRINDGQEELLKAIFAIGQEVIGHLLLTVLLTLIRQIHLLRKTDVSLLMSLLSH